MIRVILNCFHSLISKTVQLVDDGYRRLYINLVATGSTLKSGCKCLITELWALAGL